MGGVARKGSAQAKRAMKLASSRGISLKSAWGIVKRGGGKRRTARAHKPRRQRRTRTKAPRRRRTRMARHKKGHGRGRGTVITPKKLLIAAPAIAGGLAAGKAALETFNKAGGFNNPFAALTAVTGIQNPAGGVGFKVDKNALMAVALPLVGGILGSKAVKIGINAAGKSVPSSSKLLNMKLARV